MTPLIITLFPLMPGKEAVSLIMHTPSNEGSGIVVYTQRQSLDTENAKPVLYRKKVILARRGAARSPWKFERRGVGFKRIEVEIPEREVTQLIRPMWSLHSAVYLGVRCRRGK